MEKDRPSRPYRIVPGRPRQSTAVSRPSGRSSESGSRDPAGTAARDTEDLSRSDLLLLSRGEHGRLYRFFGAHPDVVDGRHGVRFSTLAPGAASVGVTGSFNDWNREGTPLTRVVGSGIWRGFVPDVTEGALYKFVIAPAGGGRAVTKSDPFAFATEVPPRTASRVHVPRHTWKDSAWMRGRRGRFGDDAPVSIYELHPGSWRRPEGRPDGHLRYGELADRLVPYLEQTGFTHVELLPVMEHPFYGSWGYQTTGYFAPTARYGQPEELMELIDRLHQADIGVILDWVPSHFPADAHGLARYDGTRLYEYPDPRVGFHSEWKTYVFNFGRGEVQSFLLSSAMYWLEKFHADGLRVDAVASMLYLDYGRDEGQFVHNKYGGRENLEAVDFLRRMNASLRESYPDVRIIAEESTAWPGVSKPVYLGGLGFDMKWDMGWMHDTLEYFQLDPIHRTYHHEKITFRQMYAWSERFVLALSHDEVVHGKSPLIGKMYGDEWQKFAGLRALYGYMWALPGKKLLFMGGEIGQWTEWDHDGEVDWKVLEYPLHHGLQRYVGDLNRLYRDRTALHQLDFDPRGFHWVDCSDHQQSVVSFLRFSADGRRVVLGVGNFTPVPRHGYRVGVPVAGVWNERVNSDADIYGGSGQGNAGRVESTPERWHEFDQSIELTLPPLSWLLLEPESELVHPFGRPQAGDEPAGQEAAGDEGGPAGEPGDDVDSDDADA